MGERERVIEEIGKTWRRVNLLEEGNSDLAPIYADDLIAANLIRGDKPIIDMQKLREAIEAGDDTYKDSKQHGQEWWLDCIEGAITPILKEMGFEVKP